MKKTSTFLFLVVLTSAVGCAKTTDLGKMQEETIALVKVYMGELEVLQRRHTDLSSYRDAPAAATERLANAGTLINEGRTLAASAPTMVATAAKTGNADELVKVHDTTIEKLDHDISVAKDDLDAFEANITLFTATTPPATTPTTPAPTPDTPVSNDGAGSAAAKMPAGGTPAGHTSDIPCDAEILLQCPEGQIDACTKQPPVGKTHACVAK